MSIFNFNSQICTNKNQSERLLALGLKPETADMAITNPHFDKMLCVPIEHCLNPEHCIPAWSLGRLIKDLMPQRIERLELAVNGNYVGYHYLEYWEYDVETHDMFDNIILTIEWLIKKGYFNKEYLV